MKKCILFVLFLICLTSWAEARYQKGYYKPSTGKYVNSHLKSNSNKNKFDNYSTKGNINPASGKKGTVDPYKRPSYKVKSYKKINKFNY